MHTTLTAGAVSIALLANSATLALGQTTTRVSVDPAGQQLSDGSVWPSISRDGKFVAFTSSSPNLVANDTNATSDVFVRNVATGQTVRASVTASGTEPDGPCFQAILSADGRYVAFTSWATNLAASDANGDDTDVFVKDLQTGALDHVSVNSLGQGGNDIAAYESLSADGRFVTYYSYSTNLVPGDTNGQSDVFLHDRATGLTERVSVATGGGQVGGGALSSVSADGRFVALEIFASSGYVAVRDRLLGTTTPVSVDSLGSPVAAGSPVISDDGRFVAFSTKFSLLPADQDFQSDVYRVALTSGSTSLVTTGATPSTPSTPATIAAPTSMSVDGRFVALSTDGQFAPADVNTKLDVYVADVENGTFDLVSESDAGFVGDKTSGTGVISGNGRFVCFLSEATNLVTGDTNATYDVFLRDRCPPASWTNYGAGFPGTGGIPSLVLTANPVLGGVSSLVLTTPAPFPALALGVVGGQAAATPTVYGGTLLVAPALTFVTFALPQGISIPFSIPDAVDLCGVTFYVQCLLKDTGAAHGVSFTPGLAATIGA